MQALNEPQRKGVEAHLSTLIGVFTIDCFIPAASDFLEHRSCVLKPLIVSAHKHHSAELLGTHSTVVVQYREKRSTQVLNGFCRQFRIDTCNNGKTFPFHVTLGKKNGASPIEPTPRPQNTNCPKVANLVRIDENKKGGPSLDRLSCRFPS